MGDWRGRRGNILDIKEGGDTIRWLYFSWKNFSLFWAQIPTQTTLLTFRSMRGTVRGVRNRVRAGIATFLQDQTDKVTS